MPVNLTSEAAKKREALVQARLRASHELSLFRRMLAELTLVGRKAGEAFAVGAGFTAAEIALLDHEIRTGRILTASWDDIFPIFGNRTISSIAGTNIVNDFGFRNTFAGLTQNWVTSEGARRVVAITTTTRNTITKIVADALAEGLSVDATAVKITNKAASIARGRAATIARTELHSASNFASWASTETLNIPLQKEWIASGDGRTRETHIVANGQLRAKHAAFDVGGRSMQYPGDPAGGPKEVINCRCVLGWKTELST